MALSVIDLPNQIRIRISVGTNSSGNPIYRFRTINNVKPTASNEDVYQVGLAIAGLQRHPVEGIYRERDVKYEEI